MRILGYKQGITWLAGLYKFSLIYIVMVTSWAQYSHNLTRQY